MQAYQLECNLCSLESLFESEAIRKHLCDYKLKPWIYNDGTVSVCLVFQASIFLELAVIEELLYEKISTMPEHITISYRTLPSCPIIKKQLSTRSKLSELPISLPSAFKSSVFETDRFYNYHFLLNNILNNNSDPMDSLIKVKNYRYKKHVVFWTKPGEFFTLANLNNISLNLVLKTQEISQNLTDIIQQSCSICLVSFDSAPNESLYSLDCLHYFHTKCLNDYINKCKKNSCPFCRKSIIRVDDEIKNEVWNMLNSVQVTEKGEVEVYCQDCSNTWINRLNIAYQCPKCLSLNVSF